MINMDVIVNKETQRERAKTFQELHQSDQLFVLGNAWDVTSAKIFEIEGYKAIGTTSAGISSTLGYPDGQIMSLEENMEVTKRIVDHVNIPVSADIEAGYSDSTEGVVASAKAVLEAGAVGLNLEDSTGNPEKPLFDLSVMIERIKAIREMAQSEGIHLVINLRTDVCLLGLWDAKTCFEEAVKRGNTYREAGADCVFVPDMGDMDKQTMKNLIQDIDAPINIIAGDNTPPLAELEEIGISRVSLGPRHMRAMLALLRNIAKEIAENGTYELMSSDSLSYSEVNSWFEQ